MQASDLVLAAGLTLKIICHSDVTGTWRQRAPAGDTTRSHPASELNPSALKLWITLRTRSSLVKATFAIPATSMRWAKSSTICARRQVTTDPLPRRTIRSKRRPSSSSISRAQM
jgi:hypothetical protein